MERSRSRLIFGVHRSLEKFLFQCFASNVGGKRHNLEIVNLAIDL